MKTHRHDDRDNNHIWHVSQSPDYAAQTYRRGRVVSTPALYSVGPRFKYRPGDLLSQLTYPQFSAVPLGQGWANFFVGGPNEKK
jgi:hypothetical protein